MFRAVRTMGVTACGKSADYGRLAKLNIAWEQGIEQVTEEPVRVRKSGNCGSCVSG
jgi:hypothetical protein